MVNYFATVKYYIMALLFALMTWIAPVAPLLMLVFASVFLDTIFGVMASIKQKKPIISRKFQRIAIKCALYSFAFLLFYGVDTLILNEILIEKVGVHLFLSKVIAIAFILIEMFSIDEKIRIINKGRGIFYYIGLIYNRALTAKRAISKLVENNESTNP